MSLPRLPDHRFKAIGSKGRRVVRRSLSPQRGIRCNRQRREYFS